MKNDSESKFEVINKDIKEILAELDELVSVKHDQLDPTQLVKNNDSFIRLIDQLNKIKPIIQTKN